MTRTLRDVGLALLLAVLALGALAGLALRRGPTLVALAGLAAIAVYARAPLAHEDAWVRARLRHRLVGLDGCRWLPEVQADEHGSLRRTSVRWWREQLVVLEVANYTPEPDGRMRTFLIRVPPGVRTARAAVAWTFGLEEKDYHPEEES